MIKWWVTLIEMVVAVWLGWVVYKAWDEKQY